MTAMLGSALSAACLATALFAAPALASGAFYQGKTVTIVVGASPGGGYDAYARAVAQFLPDHIPGRPDVVVQYMPGAGSLVAVRALNTIEPKDGTVLVTFNPGLVTRSIVQPNVVKVDFKKLAWVGAVTPDFFLCDGYGPDGVKSWDELMHGKKTFIIGGAAKGSGDYVYGAILRVVFGAPVKQVLGFPGSAQKHLAIEQGELNGDCGSYNSIPQDWLNKKLVHIFVRFTKERPAGMPASAAFVEKFAKNEDQKQLLDFLIAENEVGRPFVMSAAAPADRVEIMRKAFDDTMRDPGFLAQAKSERLSVHPVSGQEAEGIVARIFTAPPAIVDKAKELY